MPPPRAASQGPGDGGAVRKQEPDGLFAAVWPDGLAGIRKAGVFATLPSWVDGELAAGSTAQTKVLGFEQTMKDLLAFRFFFFSPNLVWASMALAVHFVFPYEIDALREGYSLDVLLRRLVLNFSVCGAYYLFFYVGLYHLGWAKRKYSPGTYPTFGNMCHNAWYWGLGVFQWTLWEMVMTRLWATGKVGFVTDAQVWNDKWLLAKQVFWLFAVPVWRDVHFYFAHRFIHIRAVYKYVHSLHHRNADPEPFSGMTMHPIEHIYYFSNAFTPTLFLNDLSPFVFLWLFIHLTIAPAAGHSGWEDHFQADQYHYTHHRKFECNYGSPFTGFIDQYFGTFREKLGDSKEYKGEWSEKAEPGTALKEWSAQGYLGVPANLWHGLYTLYWVALFPFAYWAFAKQQGMGEIVGFIMGYSPPLVALLLCVLEGDRLSWRWPFQKEKFFGAFGLFLALGTVSCLHPIYVASKWAAEV
eukprot:Hpha_TRINITY_DN15976_c2_g6::TRINITY_DN15976_c2_g6_i1::g.73995::m.73995